MESVSATEKLACIKREIGQRKWVYPRWVAAGKMTKQKADKEIAVMEAIAADYETLAGSERLL